MQIAVRVVAAQRRGEDRAAALACGNGRLLLVADGAGGRSGGAAAADAVLQAAQLMANRQTVSNWAASHWAAWLEDLDRRLSSVGETTAVVVLCTQGQLYGASVGDSAAWLISPTGCVDLTEQQRRKPLLGSGEALATGFGPVTMDIHRGLSLPRDSPYSLTTHGGPPLAKECPGPSNTRLLLASDGLLKYVTHDRIQRLVRTLTLEDAASALIEAAKLPSGTLCDDIALVIAG